MEIDLELEEDEIDGYKLSIIVEGDNFEKTRAAVSSTKK